MAIIGVIDYGMGNLHSIAKAMEHVAPGMRVQVSPDPDELLRADRLVLPGVGGIAHCMQELQRLELDELVQEVAGTKPLLGICLGMQALLTFSDENEGVDALDVFPGQVKKFVQPTEGPQLKIPHMGWNQVHWEYEHVLWRDVPQDSWFYFVHSFRAVPDKPQHMAGSTEYGSRFASSLLRDNVFAVQFHPEKSQAAGLALLANFAQWDGQA